MKDLSLFFCMMLFGSAAFAASGFPMDANTPDGKSVTLYEDGTWRPKTLELGHSILRKSTFATKKHSSRLRFYEFWSDRKIWSAQSPQENEHFEFLFQHKGGEAWCGIIPERMQLTQDGLVKAALQNFQAADKSGKFVQRSMAFVNALKGDVVEFSGTLDGVYISYYSFLWSGAPGTAQLSCWTSTNLIDEYRPIFNDFFGGFMLVGG